MSLQIWLPLNGHINNQGLSNITTTNINAAVTTHNRGQCYLFNPNNENNQGIEMNIPDMPQWCAGDFTIAFWINHNDAGARSIIFGSYKLNSDTPLNIEKTASDYLRVYMGGTPDWSAVQIPANTWVHYTIVKNATQIIVYQNGERKAARAHGASDKWNQADCTKFRLGRDSRSDATCMNGMLSDFRFYNHALSVKEIKELSLGLICNLSFNSADMIQSNNLLEGLTLSGHGSTWTKQTELFQGEPIYKNVVNNPNTGNNAGFRYINGITTTVPTSKVTLSFYKRLNTIYGKNLTGYLRAVDSAGTTLQSANWSYSKANWANDTTSLGKWEKITATATFTCDITQIAKFSHMYVYVDQATGGDCDFSQIKLEFGDTASSYWADGKITDVSGYGNHGTIVGPHYLSTETDRGSYSLRVAGTRSPAVKAYVTMPLKMSSITAYTFAANFKINTWGHQTSGIFSASTKQNDAGEYYTSCCHHRDSYFDIAAKGNTSTSTSSTTYRRLGFTTSDFPAGKWGHVAVTYDGIKASLYINGVLKRSVEFPSATELCACNYMILSFSNAGGSARPSDANWSDFRAYTTALSAEEIKTLAEPRMAIDKNSNGYCFELIEEYETTPNLTTTGNLIASVKKGFVNLYPGTQTNASQMTVTYNYPTDIFTEYGFNTCTKFTPNSVTDKKLAYSYIMPIGAYKPSKEYSFSCYAYVSPDCDANLRINLEQSATWIKNYAGTTANINDSTKGQVIRAWGTVKTNADGYLYIMFYPNMNQANVFTKGYFLIAGMTVCEGTDIPAPTAKIASTINLITTMSAGGRTTLNGKYGLDADFSQNVDTYGYFNVSPALKLGTAYTLSFKVANFPDGGSWGWQLWNDADYSFKITKNGAYKYTFIPDLTKLPTSNLSLTKFLFDDGARSGAANIVKFTEFSIVENNACVEHGFFETNQAAIHKGYIEMHGLYEN